MDVNPDLETLTQFYFWDMAVMVFLDIMEQQYHTRKHHESHLIFDG